VTGAGRRQKQGRQREDERPHERPRKRPRARFQTVWPVDKSGKRAPAAVSAERKHADARVAPRWESAEKNQPPKTPTWA
jgi:hypothetical protein